MRSLQPREFLRKLPLFLYINTIGGVITDKPFFTYDEQIDKLVSKGLDIIDKELAINILKRTGYFGLISGYKEPFKNKEKNYKKNVSILDIYLLYLFDEALRNLFLKYIVMVERKFKSLLSYAFCEKFGENQNEYLAANNYNYEGDNIPEIDKLIKKIKDSMGENSKYPYITHQHNKHGNIPLWAIIRTLTFGNISKMYSLSRPEIKAQISKEFDGIVENDVVAMLGILTRFRNICAHDERLYDYRINKMSLTETSMHQALYIQKDRNRKYIYGRNDLFAVVISLKYLLDSDDFATLCSIIQQFIDNLMKGTSQLPKTMLLKRMGFPENWYDIVQLEVK